MTRILKFEKPKYKGPRIPRRAKDAAETGSEPAFTVGAKIRKSANLNALYFTTCNILTRVDNENRKAAFAALMGITQSRSFIEDSLQIAYRISKKTRDRSAVASLSSLCRLLSMPSYCQEMGEVARAIAANNRGMRMANALEAFCRLVRSEKFGHSYLPSALALARITSGYSSEEAFGSLKEIVENGILCACVPLQLKKIVYETVRYGTQRAGYALCATPSLNKSHLPDSSFHMPSRNPGLFFK